MMLMYRSFISDCGATTWVAPMPPTSNARHVIADCRLWCICKGLERLSLHANSRLQTKHSSLSAILGSHIAGHLASGPLGHLQHALKHIHSIVSHTIIQSFHH